MSATPLMEDGKYTGTLICMQIQISGVHRIAHIALVTGLVGDRSASVKS